MNPDDDTMLTSFLTTRGVRDKVLQNMHLRDESKPYWASMHQYDLSSEGWGRHSIEIHPFNQSGRTHYFGVIQLGVADMVCRVPALAQSTESLEIARRTLREDPTAQYQRPLGFPRMENLNRFLQSEPTIVNPIIIHIPEESLEKQSVSIRRTATGEHLEIDLTAIPFLARTGKDVDDQTGIDFRPIDLVDGQHRVRACGLEEASLSTTIPFVLLDREMDQIEAARIFAEINVQSEDLKDLHKLHLKYVLQLPHHELKSDYSSPTQAYLDGDDEGQHPADGARYANRLAYKIGATLTLEETSPLHNLLKFFDTHTGDHAIDAKQWVAYARAWILQKFAPTWKEDDVVQIIRCYFEAWKQTANTDPTTGELYTNVHNTNRWGILQRDSKGKNPKSRAFEAASFKAIMSLFPHCYRMAKHDLQQEWSTLTENFVEALKPCQAIDFGDFEVWTDQIFGGNRKANAIESHLYHWMAWAVREYELTKERVKPELAWNVGDSIVDSAPGQGFFSPVNPDFFTGTLKVENMRSSTELKDVKITFTANAMPNESVPKNISFSYADASGRRHTPPLRDKLHQGNIGQVGFNYFWQTFGTGPDSRGIQKFCIEVTTANLYSSGQTVFRREYTLQELYALQGGLVYISSETSRNPNNSKGDDFEDIEELDDDKDDHYAVPFYAEEDDKEPEEDDGENAERVESEPTLEEDLYNSPLPKNSFSHRPVYHRWSQSQRCNHCFHGIDHRCRFVPEFN